MAQDERHTHTAFVYAAAGCIYFSCQKMRRFLKTLIEMGRPNFERAALNVERRRF